jgi:hypothetical protein
MISGERLSQALTYLAETDEVCAGLRADMERAEFKAKATKDAIFCRLSGSVADRTANASDSVEYHAAMDNYFGVLKQYEAMRNKRSTEAIVIEVWRSLNSSRNKGNL